MGGVELGGHVCGGLARAAELEARRPPDHLDVGAAGDSLQYLLGDAVGEVGHLRIAGEVVEREHRQQRLGRRCRRIRRGDPDARLGCADQFADRREHLAPAGRRRLACPADQVGALELVERHRQWRFLDGELDQLARGAGAACLRAHIVGPGRIGRPDHQHGLGGASRSSSTSEKTRCAGIWSSIQTLVAQAAQRLGHLLGLRGGRARVADEDVQHAGATPPLQSPAGP